MEIPQTDAEIEHREKQKKHSMILCSHSLMQ